MTWWRCIRRGAITEIETQAVAATIEFTSFMRDYVESRRTAPGDDLLTQLIAAEQEGQKLSSDELVTTAILLLNAGHEATVHALGNGIKALLGARVSGERCDPRLVEELLRFDAPLHLFTRYALEDVEFAGIKLRKGEEIGLLLGAANRDPAPLPRTRPLRSRSASPMPACELRRRHPFLRRRAAWRGSKLEVALPILFERLPRLGLAGQPRYRDSYHFHGLESLEVTW